MPRKAKKVAETPKKTRKPYPSIDERIAAAEQEIEHLTRLNEERVTLIAKTEAKLEERRSALAKSQEALAKELAKKEHLLQLKNRPVKAPGQKLTAEERKVRRQEALAKARAVKKAEKEKLSALMSALKDSGKTVDELLAELNQ